MNRKRDSVLSLMVVLLVMGGLWRITAVHAITTTADSGPGSLRHGRVCQLAVWD